jgi:hypothetical protein
VDGNPGSGGVKSTSHDAVKRSILSLRDVVTSIGGVYVNERSSSPYVFSREVNNSTQPASRVLAWIRTPNWREEEGTVASRLHP